MILARKNESHSKYEKISMKYNLAAAFFAGIVLTAATGATGANAMLIDFEDIAVPLDGNVASTSHISGDYTFTNTAAAGDLLVVYNGVGYCSGGCFNNGSNILSIFNSDATPPFEMVMTRTDGQAFNLLSFDTAPLFDSIGNGSQNLFMTATLAGGGTVSSSITYDALAGSQLASPGFMNAASVFFQSDGFWVSIDNMRTVPAPATLALFGLGLAGFGWSRRKKA